MVDNLVVFHRNAIAMLLGLSLFVAACGGSGDGGVPEGPGTGTVALLLTDLPTDDIKAINFDVVEATLIGDQGQQTVYTGNTRVNLLDLENYSQARGVTIIPELDVPGHSSILRRRYPEIFGKTPTDLASSARS